MSQTALVMCIYFFIKLQNSVEVDATYSLPSDQAVNATYLASSLITTRMLPQIIERHVTKPEMNNL